MRTVGLCHFDNATAKKVNEALCSHSIKFGKQVLKWERDLEAKIMEQQEALNNTMTRQRQSAEDTITAEKQSKKLSMNQR